MRDEQWRQSDDVASAEEVIDRESDSSMDSRRAADVADPYAKGRRVLDLCVASGKGLCVQGYIDSHVELGGEHLDLLRAMTKHLESRLADAPIGSERRLLRELHAYIVDALPKTGDGRGGDTDT